MIAASRAGGKGAEKRQLRGGKGREKLARKGSLARENRHGFDNRQFGYVTWTNWSQEIVKKDARTYDSHGMSFWVWDPAAATAAGVDSTLPEVDIVRSHIQLIDCNTFTATVDLYAGYLSFTPEKTPFVTPPDIYWLEPGVTLVETYHRMPTACPSCPLPSTSAMPAANLGLFRPKTPKK